MDLWRLSGPREGYADKIEDMLREKEERRKARLKAQQDDVSKDFKKWFGRARSYGNLGLVNSANH
jgi:hypothetical protein